MVLWSIELGIALWFGYEFVTYLTTSTFRIHIRFAIGSLIGQYTFAWLVFLFSSGSSLQEHHGTIATTIQFALAFILNSLNSKLRTNNKFRIHIIEIVTYMIFGPFFIYLMYVANMLENKCSVGAGYGDFPFHLNIINSFAIGMNNRRSSLFNVSSIFYADEPLAYPMMTNFYTASLMITGQATMRAALLFPSTLVILSLMIGIYEIAFLFSGKHFAGFLSLFLFINLGGLGFARWKDPTFDSNDGVFHVRGATHYYWFHPLMHILVPQRASLYSMPLCYWTLFSLVNGITLENPYIMMLAGTLTALGPQFQVHCYVALAQWAICFCIFTFPFTQRKKWSQYIFLWASYGIVAILFGLPQFYPFLSRLSSNRREFVQFWLIFRKFMPGERNLSFRPIRMWWRGLGVFAAIALCFGLVLLDKNRIKMYGPSLIVFFLTNVILYQPWECDNLKLHYDIWIPFALPLVSLYFLTLLKNPLSILIAIPLLGASALSAAHLTRRALSWKSQIYDDRDYNFGLWLAENTPMKSRFATSQWHAHPCGTVAGRQLWAGYGGWIGSHGLEYGNKMDAMRKFSKDYNNKQLYLKHNINYVISKNNEFQSFDQMENNSLWNCIYDYAGYRVWRRNF